MEKLKRCTKCKQEFPATDEYFYKKGKKECGLRSICKECFKKGQIEYERDRGRNKRLIREYNITEELFNEILEMQGGKCAICQAEECMTGKAFCVDHDHETMEVRGLLCINCNQGCGKFKDDPDLLEEAASYLRRVRKL